MPSARPPAVPAELFESVTSIRMPTAIVDQLRAVIRTRRLGPGERLPSERELGEQFRASRVTVREALRVLQAQGLIESRVGARGGWYVTDPTPERLAASLGDLLDDFEISPYDVVAVRFAIELAMVPLVIQRASVEDVDALVALAEPRAGEGRSRSAQFHVRVAASTHNPALEVLMRALHRPGTGTPLRGKRSADANLGNERSAGHHRRFAVAVAERDVGAAISVLREHERGTSGHPRGAGVGLS